MMLYVFVQCFEHNNLILIVFVVAVALFFKQLQNNEGEQFNLYYDDLPVYYVPAAYKDKLYLMANLFTKYVSTK